MKRVKQCTRAFRVCSFTACFSLLKCIKNDRKIQDMGAENVYIYISYDKKSHKECRFFFKISMITNVILLLYNSSINNKLILRYLRFRCHIACFCSISPSKNNSTQLQHCFASLSNMRVICSWMIQSFKWFNSAAVTQLLPVTFCHLLAILISHLNYFCF